MADYEFVDNLKPSEMLRSGFTVGSGVAVYYHEGMKKGVSGADIFLLQGLMGREWEKFKTTLKKVPEREEELPEPVKNTNYGGWESGYITLMKKGGLDLVHEKQAWKDFEALDAEVDLSDIVTLTPDQIAAFDPEIRPQVMKFVTVTGTGLVINGKMLGKRLSPKETTPYYQPTYMTKIPDLGIIKKMGKLVRQVSREKHEMFAQMYVALVDATATYVLSSGNLNGQIGRIIKGLNVRKAMNQAVGGASDNLLAKALGCERLKGELFSPQIPFQAFAELMKKRAPFAPRPPNATLYSDRPSTLLLTYNLIVKKDGAKLITINHDASSGQLLRPLKKVDTTVTDAFLADWLLDKLNKCVVNGRVQEELYTSFWRTYGSLFIPQTKNKMEIGERAKLATHSEVWRNYFVFNSFTQLPAQMLCENIYNRWDKTTQEPTFKNSMNDEIWSLLGWSCYGNGLQDLLFTMARQAKRQGFSIAVYSDNVYVLQYIKAESEFYWYSLDGSSMECSINKGDASYFMQHVIENYWGGEVTTAWKIYGETFYKDLAVDGRALLGSIQWQNIGQFSGTGGTAYLNNEKMILRCAVLEYLLKQGWEGSLLKIGTPLPERNSTSVFGERVLDPKLDRAFFLGGVSVKVELVTHTDLFHILLGEERELPDAIISLDILGMDAAWIPSIPEMGGLKPVFPVLNKDKLIRAVAYNKMTDKLSTKEQRVIESMRLKALYLLGAWRYEPLADLLRDRIGSNPVVKTARARVEKGEGPYEEIMQEAIKDFAQELDPESIEEISLVLGSIALPYWFDVMKVYKNISYAREHLLSVLESEGKEVALKLASITSLIQAIYHKLSSLKKEKVMEWIEKLKSLGRLDEVNELVEIAQESTMGDTQSVADFKSWLSGIREKLDVNDLDVARWELLEAKADVAMTIDELPDFLAEALEVPLVKSNVKPHVSSYVDVKQLRRKLNLKSYSDSKPNLIGSKVDPLSPYQTSIIAKIIDSLKDRGEPASNLYNYADLVRHANLSVEEKAELKKHSFTMMVHLDRKLDKMFEKVVSAVENPEAIQANIMIKKKRAERKESKRDYKLEKMERAEREAEERSDLHLQLKEEAKKEKKKKRAESKEKEEEQPQVPPPIHPMHTKPLLHWASQTVVKGALPPPPPKGFVNPMDSNSPVDLTRLINSSGDFGEELESALAGNAIGVVSYEKILRGLAWIRNLINSGQVASQRSELADVIKRIRDTLKRAYDEWDEHREVVTYKYPTSKPWVGWMFDLPFFSD